MTDEDILETLLTPQEHAAVGLAGSLMPLMREIVGNGPSRQGDLREARAAVHVLQNMVLANAAARAFAGEYRLLGQEK